MTNTDTLAISILKHLFKTDCYLEIDTNPPIFNDNASLLTAGDIKIAVDMHLDARESKESRVIQNEQLDIDKKSNSRLANLIRHLQKRNVSYILNTESVFATVNIALDITDKIEYENICRFLSVAANDPDTDDDYEPAEDDL